VAVGVESQVTTVNPRRDGNVKRHHSHGDTSDIDPGDTRSSVARNVEAVCPELNSRSRDEQCAQGAG
jgi:hypothetical protein